MYVIGRESCEEKPIKNIKQFLIILTISCMGEVLSYLIPLPIPPCIYGIIILFIGLITNQIPYETVKDAGHFLIEIMPVMFIPAAVGLMESWGMIKSAWPQSVFFGAFISLLFYEIGLYIERKWKLPVFNPLLIAIVLTVAVLAVLEIPYEQYYAGAKYISYLLTPATVCLAIPLYEQIELLKKNSIAILAGIVSGVIRNGLSCHWNRKGYGDWKS